MICNTPNRAQEHSQSQRHVNDLHLHITQKLFSSPNKMATTIPRWLLPRGGPLLHLQKAKFPGTLSRTPRRCNECRHASNTSSSKPRVLEKPAKFNPPSHPARLKRAPRQYPGPPLSAPEIEAQQTKQYPHMMPPEGSFMRWFLTNRSIHVWITLVNLARSTLRFERRRLTARSF